MTRAGVLRLVTVLASLVVSAALFFVAAGTLDVPRAWLLYGASFGYMLVAMTVMFVSLPGVVELVNERGKLHADAKAWDKTFGIVYTALLLVEPVLAGLDAGRFHWSTVPAWMAAPAVAVTILAYLFAHWTMVVNKHAETLVRVQKERGHQVVSSGPYRFVRHPMYVSVLVTQLVYPLAVGSLYAYVPALAIWGLLIWKTAREDRTLQEELPGYMEYASGTRYRLLPGVW